MATDTFSANDSTFDSACQIEKGEVQAGSNLKKISAASTCKCTTEDSVTGNEESPESRCQQGWRCWTLNSDKLFWQRLKDWLRPIAPKLSPSKAEARVSCLEDYPEGYPQLSWFLSSDDSFMMYRGFNQLQSRVLLQKQDELRVMERELLNCDKRDEAEGNTKYLECQTADQKRPEVASGKRRPDLLREIDRKLDEYTRCLKSAHFVQNMNKPTDRDHASLANFFHNKAPLMESDRDFIYRKEDLISTRCGREHTWLDALVEAVLRWYPCGFIKYLFCSKESAAKTTDPHLHYFSRRRISVFVTLLMTFLATILLVVPTFPLLYLTVIVGTTWADYTCGGILLGCTLLFSLALSLLTRAKRHEILGAGIA